MTKLLSVMVLLGMSALASADEPDTHYNRVSFQVQAQETVANDRMSIVLAAEADEVAPADVADNINKAMKWALRQTKGIEGIKVRTGNYTISPSYRKDGPQRWRGYQELRFEGSDFTRLSDLMASLQKRLQIKSTHFFISDDMCKLVEQRLIDKVAQRFQGRADQISKSFSAKQFVLVSVNVNTSGCVARPEIRLRAMVAEASVVAPTFEGGESKVVVNMNAVVELQP